MKTTLNNSRDNEIQWLLDDMKVRLDNLSEDYLIKYSKLIDPISEDVKKGLESGYHYHLVKTEFQSRVS